MVRFTIDGELISLNEYIRSARGDKYHNAKIKKDQQQYIGLFIHKAKLKQINKPVCINILWVSKNARIDPDNRSFAIKMICDSLVENGVLIDDSYKYVKEIHHKFKVDKKNPRIEVELMEIDNE